MSEGWWTHVSHSGCISPVNAAHKYPISSGIDSQNSGTLAVKCCPLKPPKYSLNVVKGREMEGKLSILCLRYDVCLCLCIVCLLIRRQNGRLLSLLSKQCTEHQQNAQYLLHKAWEEPKMPVLLMGNRHCTCVTIV